jgi:hypothetical protein
MKTLRSLMNAVVWAGLLSLIFTRDAHAYLDPGTGSYILQLMLAGLLGASLAVKIFWRNIQAFFSSRFSKGQEEEQSEEQDNE